MSPAGPPPAAGTRRPRARWTLRRRIVAMLLALLAAVAGIMGVVSTLALRGSLIGQIDARLESASSRAAHAPTRCTLPWSPAATPAPDSVPCQVDTRTGSRATTTGATPGATADPTAGGSLPTAVPTVAPAPTATACDAATSPSPSAAATPGTGAPFSLRIPGQDVGTLNLEVVGGAVNAGYLDEHGEFQRLTAAQSAVLAATPGDGVPRGVEIECLGSYRVIGTTDTRGNLVVTGLPTADATSTVTRYVLVEVAVALAGLLLAAVAGTLLVRRELRPLNRVAATATRVAELPLDRGEVLLAERVPAADTDPGTEVGQVGAALNLMLGHVEQALASRQESETQVRRFVADASHELRTPLASIRGYAELVRRLPGPVPGDALHAMSRVESETLRMTGLVEDMLLLARLDAGRDLEQTEVDLAGLAIDALADAHAAGPDHVWRLDLPAGDDDADDDDAREPVAPAPRTVVVGDEHRLQQVLVNLLSNARVHTPAGTVVVLAVRAEGDRVVVRVQDDGPGIDEPLLSHLFQRFTRGDASRNRAAGSTGLGLAIVHAVVVAHGGTIEVDGRAGRTAFTVSLPAAG